MPEINSFADVMQDWESLLAALRESPDLQPSLESELQTLESVLAGTRALKARQEMQNAGRQEVTQLIKAGVAQGREVAISIRAVVKGKLGYRNERLVHFRVAPVRPRSRKAAVAVKPPTGDSNGSEAATTAAK